MPPRCKLFDPKSNEPFAISRSGLEQFMRCPRCFYHHRRLVSPPKMGAIDLAVATDALLKMNLIPFVGLTRSTMFGRPMD